MLNFIMEGKTIMGFLKVQYNYKYFARCLKIYEYLFNFWWNYVIIWWRFGIVNFVHTNFFFLRDYINKMDEMDEKNLNIIKIKSN